jgi:hypothetical protein
MYNSINVFLFFAFLPFVSFLLQAEPINLPRFRNDMLRIYVFASPRPIRKNIIKKIGFFFNKSSTTVNLYLLDINSKYYSLSDDDRTIIETMVSLMY